MMKRPLVTVAMVFGFGTSACTDSGEDLGSSTQAASVETGCSGLLNALEHCPNAHACEVLQAQVDAHGCAPQLACPCFDLAMLQALDTGGRWGQQRFELTATSGLNWVGILTGGSGFGYVTWDQAGANTCNYNSWSTTIAIDYESALVCDAILNEHSLNVGAVCSSAFCP